MPKETLAIAEMHSALLNLEKYSIDDHANVIQCYNVILSILEKVESLDAETIKRLLAVCVRDMPTLKFTTTAITTITVILSKVKMGKYDPAPDLVPSALSILQMLKTIAVRSKVESLMALSYDTLMSYPEETLVAVAENYEEVVDIFNVYCHIRQPAKTRLQACHLLHKLLIILPPEKRRVFVEKGISVWFSKILPTVLSLVTSGSDTYVTLDALELLTQDLIQFDYTNNAQWHHILECICNVKLYPTLMKSLLNAGSSAWHRLWIVFIKLLKHQITQSLNRVGTPINSMLPVVEAAFKLDAPNRCKAFECWSVLIDSFATETNESNINKRLKLLIIPLKSNNAKNEETALAKFKCWWHLIRMFENKMDKYLDSVLSTLLYFCFGKHNESSVPVTGQMAANISKICNQAIVDMVGHVNCDGCTDLPKLKGKIITTKHLVDHWNHWIYSVTTVIMKTASGRNGLTKQQLTCLWKSFILTIGELPENTVRKDLFAEILSIVTHLVQECKSNKLFLDIAFNILISSFFDENPNIKKLFKSTNDPNDPIVKIVRIVLDPALYSFYDSLPKEDLKIKMKLITKLIFDVGVCTPKYIISWVLVALPTHNYGLEFWNALAEAICDVKCDKGSLTIPNMLLWPLKSISLFSEVKTPAMTWYTIYNAMYPQLNKIDIDKAISDILFTTPHTSIPSVYFKLCVVLGVLKNKFTDKNYTNCEKEINLLLNLTKTMNSYENYELVFPVMVDRIVAIMILVTRNINDNVTALILVCVKNVLQLLTRACSQESDVTHLLVLIGSLLKPLENLFAVESYSKLIPAMTYHLLKYAPLLFSHPLTKHILLSVMKIILLKTKDSDPNYSKIKSLIIDNDSSKIGIKSKTSSDVDEAITTPAMKENRFIAPETKEVPKRTQRKEANIVNTVVENGEEYVVVKSNWRFNPRKLTENQKEKLQRKREDIPALYQDLSQSQDEFRLASWRPDSQDTSSSSKSESRSSKPSNNETATEILKNLPNTNVVPNILGNFFSEKEKEQREVNDSLPKESISNIVVSTPSTKNTKSPRMALKDRVFRNVRYLIENSDLQKENQELSDDLNKTDNNVTTPTQSRDINPANTVSSAPPLLSADRPSRVKRKPIKFADLELLASKKNRLSLNDAQSGQVQHHCNIAPSSKIDTDNGGVSVTQATENNDKNQTDHIQELNNERNDIDISHNDVKMLETNGDGNNYTNKINEMESSKSKGKQITPDSDIIMGSSDKNEDNLNEAIIINSKDDREVLASKPSRVISEDVPSKEGDRTISSNDVNEAIISKTSKDVRTPNILKVGKEVITVPSTACINVMEVSTSKTSKPVKKVSTPGMSEVVSEVFIPTTSKCITEGSTPSITMDDKEETTATSKDKEGSTPKVSKHIKVPSTQSTSKTVNEVSTPKTSKDMKEVNQRLAQDDEIVTDPGVSKVVKEASTPKASEPIEEVLTPSTSKVVGNISTPKSSKRIKQVSTPTTSIKIEKPKEVSTPRTSKENKVTKNGKEVSTPKQSPKGEQKSTVKKTKKSRIEKELAIDTVEGHPYLKINSQKRLTRKALESVNTGRRKSLAAKLNKSKSEGTSSVKSDKKIKEKNTDSENTSSNSIVVHESQEDTESKEDSLRSCEIPYSDDVIESSQDSTITTISVKSTRKMPKKIPVVCVEKLTEPSNKAVDINCSQSILDCVKVSVNKSPCSINHDKDDSVLPLNKTVLEENSQNDLTENMDTEPLDEENISGDVCIVNNENTLAVTIATDETISGPETQEIAEADTQPTDPIQFMDIDETQDNIPGTSEICGTKVSENYVPETCSIENDVPDEADNQSTRNSTRTDIEQPSVASSPFRDEAKRQQDFLNNTIEISPIKTMSPDRHKKSPSPETSSDYVVILLSSPVNSNGEPLEKRGSPEVFTDDKVSPDKRDQSPPRVEISVTNTSPSSSLSLKKNRPQVRSGGRAAQMLGLCVPDKVQAIVNPERNESDEAKKLESSPMNTPARRNLRILYNTGGDNTENCNSLNENDDSDNFLKFTKSLPPVDSSPSGPILKRKLAEITDDAMISPASKRKRVSFHDPPVSTTVSVQKYIEPGSLRSPQNSAQKRLERQLRQHTPLKSPKRLDNVFKLDTVLTKTVESFSNNDDDVISLPTCTAETNSLDSWTPEVTIVRASELNDTDPICPDLIDCKDPIQNIAIELSSAEMKSAFLKALLEKITTIGDLAKMTELEVNRLFIRAPKVKVAKKVLTDYASKRAEKIQPEIPVSIDETEFDEPMTESAAKGRDTELRMDDRNVSMETEVQAIEIPTEKPTDAVPGTCTSIQANELGSESHTSVQTDKMESELRSNIQVDELGTESHTSMQVDELGCESQTIIQTDELGSESHTNKQTDELVSELHTSIQTPELGSESCNKVQIDELGRKPYTSVQTDEVGPALHPSIQTGELGSQSTPDIMKTCLSKKPDFVNILGEHLEDSSIQQMVEKLPLSAVCDLLIKKITPSDTEVVLNKILEQQNGSSGDRSKELSFVREYICSRFDPKDLVLLCSQILKVVYDRPA